MENFNNVSQKESSEEKAELDEWIAKVGKAREAIMEQYHRKLKLGLEAGRAGVISPCPVCDRGDMHYKVMPNGHVHAQCDAKVPRCIGWIE